MGNSSVLKDPIEIAFRKIYVKINCFLKPKVSHKCKLILKCCRMRF